MKSSIAVWYALLLMERRELSHVCLTVGAFDMYGAASSFMRSLAEIVELDLRQRNPEMFDTITTGTNE